MGTKPALSRELILSTAFRLVEKEGLDRLSMRRLADRLGVAPMSLYNHIPNKDALLDGLVAEMISEVLLPDPEGSSPRERLRAIASSVREAARRHPELFRIIAVRRPSSALLQVLDAEIANLLGLGFERQEATAALRIFLGYVFGYTRLETGGFFPALGDADTIAGIAGTYPQVAKSSDYLAAWDPNLEFERGLEALLDGLHPAEWDPA